MAHVKPKPRFVVVFITSKTLFLVFGWHWITTSAMGTNHTNLPRMVPSLRIFRVISILGMTFHSEDDKIIALESIFDIRLYYKMIDQKTLFYLVVGVLIVWYLGFRVEGLMFPDRPMMSSSSNPGYYHAGPVYGGTTRGMSRDIRGDPYIPYHQVGPWNTASRFPIRNRQMHMGW